MIFAGCRRSRWLCRARGAGPAMSARGRDQAVGWPVAGGVEVGRLSLIWEMYSRVNFAALPMADGPSRCFSPSGSASPSASAALISVMRSMRARSDAARAFATRASRSSGVMWSLCATGVRGASLRDAPTDLTSAGVAVSVQDMSETQTTWVYIRSEPGLFTVGFYAPDGTWHTDGDYGREEAAERAAHLNGAPPALEQDCGRCFEGVAETGKDCASCAGSGRVPSKAGAELLRFLATYGGQS